MRTTEVGLSLEALLEREARRRGVWDLGRPESPRQRLVRLARDLPYRRASSGAPEAIVREWCGTCSGKHALLRALFEARGIPTRLMLATHRFTLETAPFLPPHLREALGSGGIPDVHTFLQARWDGRWVVVDVTWPGAARALGLPANETWDGHSDMRIACVPIAFHEVRDDAQAEKAALLATHCGPDRARRETFIEALADWLGAAIGEAPDRSSGPPQRT